MTGRCVRLGVLLLVLCIFSPFPSKSLANAGPATIPASAAPIGATGRPSAGLLASPWITETITADGPSYAAFSLASDPAGRPHVAYCGPTGTELWHAWYDGSSWHLEPVPAQGCQEVALAMDSAGQPAIAYVCSAGLLYTWFDGASWHTDTVNGPGHNEPPALALNAAGHPHVAYVFYDESAQQHELRYAHHDGTAWSTQVVATRGSYYGMGLQGLALDATGVHLSWIDRHRFGADLTYSYYDGQAWHCLRYIPGGMSASLALDGAGRPHISYSTIQGQLRYTYRPAQAWPPGWPDELVVGDCWIFLYDGLALDQAGHRHLAYCDLADYAIRYAFYDGSTWFIEEVGGPWNDDPVRLALDAAASPHLVYVDSSARLIHAYRQCVQAQGVEISGAASWPIGVEGLYTATYTPPTATLPMMTWNNGAAGPVAAYRWETIGTHAVVVTAANACAQAQDSFTVTTFCQQLSGVGIGGPPVLLPGLSGSYEALPQPITASAPLTFTWDSGLTGPTAHYSWSMTGTYTITVTGTNVCGGEVGTSLQVQVLAEWPYAAYLPLIWSGDP